MPLQIQLGDLASRIARAFGVRGRIPMSLDEQIVPVAVVEFPADPPFCDVPHFWNVALQVATQAATRGLVGVKCISGVALLDEVVLSSAGTFSNWKVQLLRNHTGFVETDQIFTLNHQTEVQAGAGFPRPSMRAIQDDSVVGITGIELATIPCSTQGQFSRGFDGLCLYEGDDLVVQSQLVNMTCFVQLRGRWYPNA